MIIKTPIRDSADGDGCEVADCPFCGDTVKTRTIRDRSTGWNEVQTVEVCKHFVEIGYDDLAVFEGGLEDFYHDEDREKYAALVNETIMFDLEITLGAEPMPIMDRVQADMAKASDALMDATLRALKGETK
jgi:hypothetical protein